MPAGTTPSRNLSTSSCCRCIRRPARPRSRWASTLARKPAPGCFTRPKRTVTGHPRIFPRPSPDSKAGASPSGRKRKLASEPLSIRPLADQRAGGALPPRACASGLVSRSCVPAAVPAAVPGSRPRQCPARSRSVRARGDAEVVHEKIVTDVLRLAGENHAALVQHVHAVGEGQGAADVLLHDEQGSARRRDLAEEL